MKVGRPLKYSTPEDLQRVVDLYFLACRAKKDESTEIFNDLEDKDLLIINKIEDAVPTVSGLAYTLGMTTEALRNYEQKDEFLATVKRAKQRVEMFLEQRLLEKWAAGPIFNLKNNFGWKDKIETEHTGGLTVEKVERCIVDIKNTDC